MSLGLYLHIPYCFSKCRYCDFYSHPGERGVPDAYVDALLRELARFAPDAPLRPDTVYFGGAHHTAFTYDLTAEQMGDWANAMGIEAVYIDKDTKIRDFKRDLQIGELFYR